MQRLQGIATLILSQALLVLMVFQSANGGILIIDSGENSATEIPVEDQSDAGETEISALLLSSPILNRDVSKPILEHEPPHEGSSNVFDIDFAEPNHLTFARSIQTSLVFPSIQRLLKGSIAIAGP